MGSVIVQRFFFAQSFGGEPGYRLTRRPARTVRSPTGKGLERFNRHLSPKMGVRPGNYLTDGKPRITTRPFGVLINYPHHRPHTGPSTAITHSRHNRVFQPPVKNQLALMGPDGRSLDVVQGLSKTTSGPDVLHGRATVHSDPRLDPLAASGSVSLWIELALQQPFGPGSTMLWRGSQPNRAEASRSRFQSLTPALNRLSGHFIGGIQVGRDRENGLSPGVVPSPRPRPSRGPSHGWGFGARVESG